MKWITPFRKYCHSLKIAVAIIFMGIFCAAPAQAYNLPSVNLGLTSFLDGAPPAGPGYYFQGYAQYFRSEEFKDADGNSLLPEVADEDLSVWAFLSQLIYVSNHKLILGGKWGFNLIVPYVLPDVDYDLNLGFPEANSAGLGDVIAGPFLQWDPIMGSKGPILKRKRRTVRKGIG